jgi:hypothetical protein
VYVYVYEFVSVCNFSHEKKPAYMKYRERREQP